MTSNRDAWRPPHERTKNDATERLRQVVRQSPLIETHLSLRGLDAMGATTTAPTAVFFGVGLCTPFQLSRGVPMDLLGLLLPAERIRRATGARRLVVLVADEHAHANRFSAMAIEERTITRAYAQLVRPLQGPLEQRLQDIVDTLFGRRSGSGSGSGSG